MYADRFDAQRGVEPRSLMLAVGINGAVLLAIATASPELVTRIIDHPFTAYPVPIPLDPKPQPQTHQPNPVHREPQSHPLDPVIKTDTAIDLGSATHDLPPGNDAGLGVGQGNGLGDGGGVLDPPPVFVDARADPRFADDLQPPYPPDEQRGGREGRVVVRVLIGTDGRVHDVALVSATSDSFFAITRRQALTKWRFRPATRGGVVVETWRQMAVSFHLRDGD